VTALGLRAWRLPAAATTAAAVGLAGAGAAAYGVTVVIGRVLARDGLAPATALGIRFAFAAAVLAVVLTLRRVARVSRRDLLAALALGAVGYAGQSTLFYLSLQRGTAATSILLFYAYPALVCVTGWLALRERRPSARTGVALALSAAGSAMVAAGGGPVAIDPLAVIFALGSAAVFAVYVLCGERIAAGVDAMAKAAGVAAGAAVASAGQGALTGGLVGPGSRWLLLLAYGAFTAAAFTLMFAALARLGARHTSIVMTLEAVFAVALATLLLGETLGPWQAGGGAAIIAATLLVVGAGSAARSANGTSSPHTGDQVPRDAPNDEFLRRARSEQA
jgi:drug/metabolite transporter (DMT)-like permease